jgi:ABC-2 type transport system ATP-binding protein
VQIISGGEVTVLGQPAGAAPLRSRVGYMTQAPSVYSDLTVEENLRYFAKIVDVGPERVDEVIETVGLTGHMGQISDSLSGGQRARVSLAAALLHKPDLLVLDEPTVGLDPVLRAELWSTFHALAAGGATLLVSSHVMEEAAECSSLLLMRDGILLEEISPDALREKTGEHDLGDAFLAIIKAAESHEPA